MNRIAFIQDTHCGHRGGMTPPEYQFTFGRDGVWADLQRKGWEYITAAIDELRPACGYRSCLLLGDLIDGRGEKNGGRELITTDVGEQADMAVELPRYVAPQKDSYAMVYGTPYHAGKLLDHENKIADELHIPASRRGERLSVDVDGFVIDIAHKIGGSGTATGGDIALRHEQVNSHEWSVEHGFALPHLIVRAHVHRWRRLADNRPQVMVLPGMQLWTAFGAREVRRIVHFGFVAIDVEGERIVQCHSRMMKLAEAKSRPVKM